MSSQGKVAIGAAVLAVLVLFLIPSVIFKLVVLGVIAVPVVGYLLLDPSQRRRVRGQARKRLGQ